MTSNNVPVASLIIGDFVSNALTNPRFGLNHIVSNEQGSEMGIRVVSLKPRKRIARVPKADRINEYDVSTEIVYSIIQQQMMYCYSVFFTWVAENGDAETLSNMAQRAGVDLKDDGSNYDICNSEIHEKPTVD